MGIFNFFKEKDSSKQPEEWFYSEEGKERLAKLLPDPDDLETLENYDERQQDSCELFIQDYLKSLPNLKKLREQEEYVDTRKVAQKIFSMAGDVYIDEFGIKEEAPYYLQNLLDPKKNPYVYFMKKLNHSYYDEILEFTEKLIFDYHIDLDSDFLYDLTFFEGDTSEGYAKRVYAKMKKYVQENNII